MYCSVVEMQLAYLGAHGALAQMVEIQECACVRDEQKINGAVSTPRRGGPKHF